VDVISIMFYSDTEAEILFYYIRWDGEFTKGTASGRTRAPTVPDMQTLESPIHVSPFILVWKQHTVIITDRYRRSGDTCDD
jgi:hypothetical protein